MRKAVCLYARNRGTVWYLLDNRDFELFWRTAREKTESSKFGINFGYYIAQYFYLFVTELQVMKLNLVLSMGMLLERWLHELTVLLEKEFENINVDKLRAICLFKVDLNWMLEVILTKRMMANARKNKLVPPELSATAGLSAPNAKMAKVFHTDICWTQYRKHYVANVDLGQCYDAMCHPVCSLALQAYCVHRKLICAHVDHPVDYAEDA